MKRIEELELRKQQILDKNEHWKRCQDGSYEMALSYDGFYELCKELRELTILAEPSNVNLKSYRVTLHEEAGDKFTIVFDCYAEDTDHAIEQAENAYPNCEIINALIY